MKHTILSLLGFLLFIFSGISQDTFSIVAIDSITGEVGSAGASCVDMDNFPGYTDDFLGELFPGQGAINTQAWYLSTNQANARARMKAGDTPEEIIQWLYDNDAQNQPERRQYGIVAFVDGSPEGAAFTGTQTDDWKGHIVGPNYSIQGNILLGQEILDSMEAQFLRADGDLACKLMAALQGANVVGADTRCASNGSSSLFAFVKVAQPTDTFGFPSFVVSMRSKNGEGIEPIDSLQTLFDLVHDCNPVGLSENELNPRPSVFPNPVKDQIQIDFPFEEIGEFSLFNTQGVLVLPQIKLNKGMNTIRVSQSIPPGIYFYRIHSASELFGGKLVK
jgi:uncharacterized Ntn-hydrolase superfamily protein